MNYLKAKDCLSVERERELAILAANGNQNAKEELILSNIKFVISCIKKYKGYGLSMEELFEEGIIGLIEAIEHFNPKKGVRLITYASYWIRNVILDGINKSSARIKLSGEKARKLINLRKAIRDANQIYNDSQKIFEYACDYCNCSEEEAERLLTISQEYVWFEDLETKTDNPSLKYQFADSNAISVEDEVCNKSLMENLDKAIKNLNPMEQKVLKLHYGLSGNKPRAFSEIANTLGKSRARVHQIEKLAIERLRTSLKASGF